MKKRIIMIACLVACFALAALLEASLRSWSVHSWLSIVSHGHLFHRIVHTSELDGAIPEHYPVHTLESQRLVFSGKQYLGYASKHGFFVPNGTDWESAASRDGVIVGLAFIGRWIFLALFIGLLITLLAQLSETERDSQQ